MAKTTVIQGGPTSADCSCTTGRAIIDATGGCGCASDGPGPATVSPYGYILNNPQNGVVSNPVIIDAGGVVTPSPDPVVIPTTVPQTSSPTTGLTSFFSGLTPIELGVAGLIVYALLKSK